MAHQRLTFEQYRALDAWNFSSLKHADRSLRHAKAAKDGLIDDATAARSLGTLAHLATLEPEAFHAGVLRTPDIRRGTKAWESLQSENPDRLLVQPADYDVALSVRDAVWNNPACKAILKRGQRELTVTWTHEPTLLDCKARLDIVGSRIVADFKTCRDASPERFPIAVHRYLYHAQAAMYLEAANQEFGPGHEFVLIAVESAPPYAVAVYRMSDRAVEIGQRLVSAWRHAVRNAIKSNRWPGYSDRIEEIELPEFVMRMEEQFDVRN